MPATVELEAPSREAVLPHEVRVAGRILNRTDRTIRVVPVEVAAASLVLEVRDADEQRVALPPPPVPPKEPDRIEHRIEPGASFSIAYEGFLDPRLPPGRYRVRFFGRHPRVGGSRKEPLESPWVTFELKSASAGPATTVHVLGFWYRIWERFLRIVCLIFRRQCCRILSTTVVEVCEQSIGVDRDPACDNGESGKDDCESREDDYKWTAAFDLRISEVLCRADLSVRLGWKKSAEESSVPDPGLANIVTWILHDWDGMFQIVPDGRCCPGGMKLYVHVSFGQGSNFVPHHMVTFQSKTTGMREWAYTGVDSPHEFGHMLGSLDEYCAVTDAAGDTVLWCAPHTATGDKRGIMNGWGQPARARNLPLVESAAAGLLGVNCEVVAIPQP